MDTIRPIVIYDACILYSAPLRDLLMRLSIVDLYQAKWTETIHEEWISNLLKNRSDLTRARLDQTKEKMNKHVHNCLVYGYQSLIGGIELPDKNDRHVLAAAIKAKASIILIYNITDFPYTVTQQYNVKAQHPDDFLWYWLTVAPVKVLCVIQETRCSLKNPSRNVEEYLTTLQQQSLLKTVILLQNYKEFI
jgi:hypothetical protein